MNEQLRAGGVSNVRVVMAELLVAPGAGEELFVLRAVAPQGSTFILGATFTFVFLDDDGNETDVDRDGRIDAAFRDLLQPA